MKTKNKILEKPQFSGHETFPLRQLWLKKAYSEVVSYPNKSKVFSDDSAIVRFGVGKNMVNAIRHWALASGVIAEVDGKYEPTSLGDWIFGINGFDKFQEHTSTAWIIHWKLASEGRGATTWKWLFNFVIDPTLDSDSLVVALRKFLSDNEASLPADATLKKDIDCCLRTYIPRVSGALPEEISDSVLGELSLLQQIGRGQFEFRRGPKQSLNENLFAYCLISFWNSHFSSSSTLSFDLISHDYYSPGRIFKLDEQSLADYLQALSEVTDGCIQWSDTAGMRQVIRTSKNINLEKLLQKAYE